MKENKSFRVLVLFVILALLLLAMPPVPAQAASIAITPTSGPIGTTVAVAGSGFTAGHTIDIYFSSSWISYVTASVIGGISATFTVPSVSAGVYQVRAFDFDTSQWLAAVAFTVTTTSTALITVTPASGPVDTTVAVAGSGFTAGHTLDIYFGASFISSVIVSGTGGASITFTVPDVSAGVYQVRAFDFDTQQWLATTNFTVTATVAAAEITIRPEKGSVGTEVEIAGSGFDSREDIIVEYDGGVVDIQSGDYKTDADGEFEDTIIDIPKSTAGKHTITVVGEDSAVEGEAEFTVEPQIAISPTSGQSGTEVTITGTGFGYRSDVTVYFNNSQVSEKTADRYGSFTATFRAPAVKAGSYEVEAEDAENNADNVDFTVAATMSLNLASGKVGTELTVTGGGFSGAVTIKYDNAVAVTAAADANGAFSATFNVPVSTRGDHVITASDGTSEKRATFAVTPDINIAPADGSVGSQLTVTGYGFSGAVTIKYDDAKIATATAEANGAFSAVFSAPASTGGEHAITAADDANTLQAIFVMESEAPSAPVLLLPAAGSKAEAQTYFDWEDVTDPSGVTYTFQLASDANFTTLVLQMEGLTASEYAITADKELPATKKEAPYYWRVKAVDGALNQGEWSTMGTFYLGFLFALPEWVKYALIGLGVLLSGLLGFWLGRRYAYY